MSEKIIDKTKEILTELGKAIQSCDTRVDADEVFTAMMSELGDGLANKIWDNYVDWDKVTWE